MDKEYSVLLTKNIKPDAAFYVQGDDRLYCAAYSSVASLTVRFSGYFLNASGTVSQYAIDVFPTSDRAVMSALQTLGEGFLLSCTAHLLSGSANRGQCYVRARIQRGAGATILPVVQILGGYLSNSNSPTFPNGTIEGSLAGRGMLRSITGTDPAAGAECLEVVPTGARWKLNAIRLTLVTDATVANRRLRVGLDDGTTTWFMAATDADQAASLTVQYSLGQFGNSMNFAQNQEAFIYPLPFDLMAGWRIVTTTNAIQAGDNWAAPQLMVEEWLEA